MLKYCLTYTLSESTSISVTGVLLSYLDIISKTVESVEVFSSKEMCAEHFYKDDQTSTTFFKPKTWSFTEKDKPFTAG